MEIDFQLSSIVRHQSSTETGYSYLLFLRKAKNVCQPAPLNSSHESRSVSVKFVVAIHDR